jgi:hypothetical protein
MDNANDNEPAEIRGSYSLLPLALLVSCALWFIAGLAAGRVFSG